MANLSAASAAEVVLPSDDLDADVRFFVDTLGLRLELIFPADDPSVAVVSGRGLRLRLDGTGGAAFVIGVMLPGAVRARALFFVSHSKNAAA